jgi:diacylglycerol kinase family enzyme
VPASNDLVAVVIVALAVLVVLVGGVATLRRHRSAPDREEPPMEPAGPLPRAAVIVNPTKFTDVPALRREVTGVCRDAGWAEPLWIETTVQDTGHGQAKQALDAGVDLVCPLGGDGTVREVAEALVHTGVPVGLLPGGTGNLLARTLELPIDDLPAALRIALTGTDHKVDVGRVQFRGASGEAVEKVFLVMAGLGFDAAMMEGAPERLKAKVGWLAYALSGLRNLRGPDVRVRIGVDDRPPFGRRVRTVLVGNCGTLTGGIVLLPEAEVDDGWLDAVAMSPKGVFSWASVAVRVLTKSGHQRVEHIRCRQLTVTTDRPQQGQLDGDTVGEVRGMRATVDPGALVVRLPGAAGA